MGIFDFFKSKSSKKINDYEYDKKLIDDIDRTEQIKKELMSIPSGVGRIEGGAGTIEIYQKALANWELFLNYYKIDQHYKREKCYPFRDIDENGVEYISESWNYEIDALNIIIDIAPKIFDNDVMTKVLENVSNMKLEKYPLDKVKTSFYYSKAYHGFFKKYITNEEVKQTELVSKYKEYPDINPNLDPTWLFYIWRQFALISVEKKGRYNYIKINPENLK